MLPQKSPDIFTLQLQIRIKKQKFDQAIRNEKEFSEVKVIYLEIKELERQMNQWKRENIDYSN